MKNFYTNEYFDDYINQIDASSFWKISKGALMSRRYGQSFLEKLEDIAELPVKERESAMKELIWEIRE